MKNHIFKISGVEAEITYIGGEQQGILTKSKSQSATTKMLYDLAKSLTIRIGSFILSEHSKDEVDDFFKSMLICHVRQILTEARTVTYEGEDFVFSFDAEEEVDGRKTKVTHEKVVPLEGGFPVTPVKRFVPDLFKGVTTVTALRSLKDQITELECADYGDVVKNSVMNFDLPKSGLKFCINMRNGLSAEILGAVKQKELDSNAIISASNPKYWSEGLWINFDLGKIRKAHAVDLEYIRMMLKLHEGAVDTELEFENPSADNRKEYTDLLSQPSFFFLSGGI